MKDRNETSPVEIDLDILLLAVTRAVRSMKATRGSVVSIDQDWFWEVPEEFRHRFEGSPAASLVGSYADAYETVRSGSEDLLESNVMAVPVLQSASYLLRELAESRLRD
jgi:hypothetical protein